MKISNTAAEATVRSVAIKMGVGVALFSAILLGPVHTLGRAQNLSTDLLEAINQSWYELSPRERSRALENYQRFQRLPPEKQRAIEEQYNRWQQLPSEERERIRRNYDRYRGMDLDEKEDFQRKYEKWRSRSR